MSDKRARCIEIQGVNRFLIVPAMRNNRSDNYALIF